MPGYQFGDLIIGIIQIPENSRPGGTDLNTGWFQTCIDPVMAEVTLLNDRDQGVNVSGIVRARGETIFTTDTAMLIDNDDSVVPFPGCLDRAIDDTGRVVTLIAESRKKVACNVWISALLNNLHPGAKHPKGNTVFCLTGHGTTVATDAASEIDHHSIPFLARLLFHCSFRLKFSFLERFCLSVD